MEENNNVQDLNEILMVRREKLKTLQDEGKNPFDIKTFKVDYSIEEIMEKHEQLTEQIFTCAGRIIAKRVMGKASFAHIQDRSGKLQLYIKIDELGEEVYGEFKKFDIGDIVGVTGTAFVTQRGEKSVKVSDMVLLCKSLQPLPEKWHGLKDVDLRYRQRYVDLIVNPEVKQTFILRSKIISAIREYMDSNGFLEVDTPVLQNHSTNSASRPFKTHHNTLDIDMFMRVETELALKRLIVGGLEKVYEMGRIFRNEGMSNRHNPEFTSIELYEAYTDYNGMARRVEEIFLYIADKVFGKRDFTYQGTDISLKTPFESMTMVEAVKKYTGVDFNSFELDDLKAREMAKLHHIKVEDEATWGGILNEFFEEKVEEHLIQPTFIKEYPIEVSPLAKKIADMPHMTERFEIFLTSREIGNAFTELNDPIDQRERFIEQAKQKLGDEDYSIDEDFIHSLEIGMPPTGGLGLGVDRMIMFFTDSDSIRDVLLFPTMKPAER
ncbi:MAG: lysine--tRNA ligase [Clostridia bacterium]|nr:lysine--tRNA ligase [Clostridia bacterium]